VHLVKVEAGWLGMRVGKDPINNMKSVGKAIGRSLDAGDVNRPPLICHLTGAKDSPCMG
jgi:hypothetical protein